MATPPPPPGSVRAPLRKGAWTVDEDVKLTNYIVRYGHWNWNQIPRFAGLARSGQSCRSRWMHYLRPDIKRGNVTREEDEIIINLHKMMGNKWSMIASHLPGRTDNEIKNHWHKHLKKLMNDEGPPHATTPMPTGNRTFYFEEEGGAMNAYQDDDDEETEESFPETSYSVSFNSSGISVSSKISATYSSPTYYPNRVTAIPNKTDTIEESIGSFQAPTNSLGFK